MPKELPLIKGTKHQHDFTLDEYNVSGPFNISNRFPFDVGDDFEDESFQGKRE